MPDVVALIEEARAAGIVWRLEGDELRVYVPPGTEGLLARLKAIRDEVAAIVRAELEFDSHAVKVGPGLCIRRFATRAAAEAFVEKYAAARAISRLDSLGVQRAGASWVVLNPDYDPRVWVLDPRGQVQRRVGV